eukprot:scaffold23503_cov35-Cyclotella_meneghiniana.AAC.3
MRDVSCTSAALWQVDRQWLVASWLVDLSNICRRTRRETLLAVMFNITMIAWAVIDDSRPRRRVLLDESCPFVVEDRVFLPTRLPVACS